MNILNKIKSLFNFKKYEKNSVKAENSDVSMQDREEKIFEKERLNLQKLYEQWSCEETWLLYEEGIPLLFGIEPQSRSILESDVSEKIESLWQHAKECGHKKLLPVINIEKPEKEWEVRPIDLYSWGTISRIMMPEEFSTLMTFVAQTIKPVETQSSNNYSENSQDIMYLKHREVVLGAAMSLLVSAPELCKNRKGRVVSNKIARNILENEDQWFGDERPLLAETAMADLIDEYLKLTQPIVH
ncbi:MAG: hypothetical protein HND53_10055 [Proteobacteria bacterium]|nr:hypothetical protein [Pseudomonadota bacterium]NOG60832.1 hypothetical protein [Pseudomonadota bacterium]